jgi:hypothetical protein
MVVSRQRNLTKYPASTVLTMTAMKRLTALTRTVKALMEVQPPVVKGSALPQALAPARAEQRSIPAHQVLLR